MRPKRIDVPCAAESETASQKSGRLNINIHCHLLYAIGGHMPCRRGGCQMIIGVLCLQAMHWLGTLLQLFLFVNAESL
jgi:hypothetical protein